MRAIKVIAWDFDGVLNRNFVDGRFVWADDFERDIGQSRDKFIEQIFGNNFDAVMTGREDLRDRVAEWASNVGYDDGPDALLNYWFMKDALLDAKVMNFFEKLQHKGFVQVIATNNERRRAAYIGQEMGLLRKADRIFASGRIGVAKPASEFFEHITSTLGVEATNILLVDDHLPNVEEARSLGWHALHFTEKIRDTLEQHLPL